MQGFINKHFFNLFVFTYLFGILFYNIIGFQYIDELCALILVIVYIFSIFKDKNWEVNKVFLITLGIFFFFLAYSFKIHSNTPKGIIMDFLIQLKPYLAFFCVYQLKPILNEEQKKILNQLTLLIWIFILLPVGILGMINIRYFKWIMDHPTNYAATVAITSLIFFFTCNYNAVNRYKYIGLLSIGLASARSKFYGFFIISSSLVLYFTKRERLKLKPIHIIGGFIILAAILFATKEKVEFYFIQDIGEDKKDTIARFALYVTSFAILKDYFPFGTGFASFGTYASGVHYSNTYVEYSLDNVWGLSRAYSSFVADTYYPSLAQFGIVGVMLYIYFWLYILWKTYKLDVSQNLQYFSIIASITAFLAIENIADAALTSNKGFFMMLMLGYVMANLHHESRLINEKSI